MRTEKDALTALMKRYGIQQTYRAATGDVVRASADAVLAVLGALGVDTKAPLAAVARQDVERTASTILDPVIIAWNGSLQAVLKHVSAAAPYGNWELQLENGEVVRGETARRVLPLGYHELRIHGTAGVITALVIAAPRRCYGDERTRGWGVFAPLYALRETRQQPIGNFADLASLMRWTAQQHGNVVATLPISASFLRMPFEPSPYAPASRLFWNEIFLVTDRRLDHSWSGALDVQLVDYRAVAAMKRAPLETEAAHFFVESKQHAKPFREFQALYPNADDYAAFRAAGERFSSGWMAWPEAARAGRLTKADYAQSAFEYHLYAQFLVHQQLTALANEARASRMRLYLDMPLGVHPESFDIWRNRELFVTGAAAGAPPDPFFTKGQNWGFPPMHPLKLRQYHYSYWRAVLQTQLRYAGVLRLDHVMALHRLYFVPQGFEAKEGVYVRYPAEELYAVLALESARHKATIVGEDLGTVPAEVRKSMAVHGVKRMFVVQFEASDDARRPLGDVPAGSVASLNTHDMPPFAAYWEGRDADLRKELDLIDETGVAEAHQTRARTAAALSRSLGHSQVLDARAARDALLQLLAGSSADIVLVNLEDLWLETEPQNVPGTSEERPNWRRRLKRTLAELRADPHVRETLAVVQRARQAGPGTGTGTEHQHGHAHVTRDTE